MWGVFLTDRFYGRLLLASSSAVFFQKLAGGVGVKEQPANDAIDVVLHGFVTAVCFMPGINIQPNWCFDKPFCG